MDTRTAETSGDDIDDGGFRSMAPDGYNSDGSRRVAPPLPKTLPPSETSSLRQFSDLNENSSLATNKIMPPWQTQTASNSENNFSNINKNFQQLPILNLNSNNNINQTTPPTPTKRLNDFNNNNNNNIENLTLSSTSLSMRHMDERRPSTYKNINDITPSATEFFNNTNIGSINGLNNINDNNNNNNNTSSNFNSKSV
jgi:hypothetical protein